MIGLTKVRVFLALIDINGPLMTSESNTPEMTETADIQGTPETQEDRMTAAECAEFLKEKHPALFAGAPKPLKLRIQHDIQALYPGVFSRQVLASFLRRYTHSGAYLKAILNGQHRFDLNGEAAGDITDEHRSVAEQSLKERQSRYEEQRQQERAKQKEAELQREKRSAFLKDFESTTLTRENFSALKGIPMEDLEETLEKARQERVERTQYLSGFLAEFKSSSLDVQAFATQKRMHPAQVDRLLREAQGQPPRHPAKFGKPSQSRHPRSGEEGGAAGPRGRRDHRPDHRPAKRTN